MAFHRALILALGLSAGMAHAQQATIAFGELEQDTTQPVEVTADQLAVNNAEGSAVFSGNVMVTQGEMTLSAAEVSVTYGADQSRIEQLVASGGVTITNLADKASAAEAVYTIDNGVIVMTGDVRLAQGSSTMQGQKLTIHLKDGTGIMEGRVTTTFVPGGN
ncbi:MAG: lipopolysaccharide transport periplasmic protein LptA [Paracoccaceae bacterium]|nr:lipopolysaccharide transport periplasmic protein LptA [Paracoccaceae bacterium]